MLAGAAFTGGAFSGTAFTGAAFTGTAFPAGAAPVDPDSPIDPPPQKCPKVRLQMWPWPLPQRSEEVLLQRSPQVGVGVANTNATENNI